MKYYFLEMNTRIQVEHPVTELVTNNDLISMQINYAFNRKNKFLNQNKIKTYGHAIECRVYAEDPSQNFLPSPGKITKLKFPKIPKGIRLDWGYDERDEVSFYYDPMIAKLCTWGKDRSAAIGRMQTALDAFTMRGIGHNIPFLSAVMEHARFISGNITTAFIEDEYKDGFCGVSASPARKRHLGMIMAAAACGEASRLNPKRVSIPTHPRHDDNAHRQIVQFIDIETGSHDPADDQALNITMTDNGRFNISTFTGDDSALLDLSQATDHPRLHAVITEDGVKSDYICELSRRQDSWHLY